MFGCPLPSEEDQRACGRHPRPWLDGVSSAAYGSEAAPAILAVLGVAGITYIAPISLAIIGPAEQFASLTGKPLRRIPASRALRSWPKPIFGTRTGLLAGAPLIIDYALNVAVGISANVGAIVSGYQNFSRTRSHYAFSFAGADHYQSARPSRNGNGVYGAHLYVRRVPWGCTPGRDFQDQLLRRAYRASCACPETRAAHGGGQFMSGEKSLRQRMCGDDRRAGR